MITHQVISVTEVKADAIAHQANCFHTMSGGVAAAIRQKYPEAYEADLKTAKGSRKKLGSYSRANTSDGKIIFNVYSQFDLSAGIGDRATLYDMVDVGLRSVENRILELVDKADDITLAIPYKYGCALGGGSWPVVEAIIRDIFEKSPINVILCEWPPNVIKTTSLVSALTTKIDFDLSVFDSVDNRPFTA